MKVMISQPMYGVSVSEVRKMDLKKRRTQNEASKKSITISLMISIMSRKMLSLDALS
jgi:hypothetical protein